MLSFSERQVEEEPDYAKLYFYYSIHHNVSNLFRIHMNIIIYHTP